MRPDPFGEGMWDEVGRWRPWKVARVEREASGGASLCQEVGPKDGLGTVCGVGGTRHAKQGLRRRRSRNRSAGARGEGAETGECCEEWGR